MGEMCGALAHVADAELLAFVKSLAVNERRATARLVAALAEVERRGLYRAQGCSSLYAYCTQVLKLSEDAAYSRVQVARLGLRYPAVLEQLEQGAVTLTALRLLAPYMTPENHAELLATVRHKPKHEIERFIATLDPRPDPPALLTPIGPDRYIVQFTASQHVHDQLFHAQHLLRHAIPTGNLAAVIERALEALIANLERRRLGAVSRPGKRRPLRAGSRAIPAEVRRAVWGRDEGQCAFIGPHGRCNERSFLEFHHLVPFAAGGQATETNIELRCRAHNAYEAELWFAEAKQ
jgi:hypothetical protein